jgi:hypothetical protein
MNTKTASVLLPGDTYQGGIVTRTSGPHFTEKGQVVRLTVRFVQWGRPVFETFDVPTLTTVA